MELTLNRIFLGSSATIGELLVNDKHLCDTLEDRVRPEGEKVYGKTAIPEGTYEVKLTHQDLRKYYQRFLMYLTLVVLEFILVIVLKIQKGVYL